MTKKRDDVPTDSTLFDDFMHELTRRSTGSNYPSYTRGVGGERVELRSIEAMEDWLQRCNERGPADVEDWAQLASAAEWEAYDIPQGSTARASDVRRAEHLRETATVARERAFRLFQRYAKRMDEGGYGGHPQWRQWAGTETTYDPDTGDRIMRKTRTGEIMKITPPTNDNSGRRHLSLRRVRDEIHTQADRAGGYNIRALLAVGSTATGVEILNESPIHLGKPATSLLDLIPARSISGGQYSYLRQTVRTNNAAPVAVGGTKPTSVFTLERVTGTLEVVAHLSEAIHEPWLADVPALDQFVQTEMVDGIGAALEDQILNGTGVSPELDGIIATGTGTQAYATSPIVTIRTAIAQLEAAGQAAAAIVLASSDWLAIETATVTGGAFLLGDAATGAPLDRIKRTLWGVPVVVSAAHAAGTAVVIAEESVGLVTNESVEFIWARINDDFSKNQIRGRAEIRAQVEVYRPAGIIVCDLTA